MESFIVQIYQRDRDNSCPVRRVIEEVGAVGQDAFGTKEELWNILSGLKQTEKLSYSNRYTQRRCKNKGGTEKCKQEN